MAQQQQSNHTKPQKVGGKKKPSQIIKGKKMLSKMKATAKPVKGKGKKKPSNNPSFGKVQDSVKKTMGY